ncbi:MAG: hypothetical protein F4Z63_10575 [Gammaproteobacteria bacterium]|nr:hypothetical protein [Gammaproteobacteria bacterium]
MRKMDEWVRRYEGDAYRRSIARLVAMHRIVGNAVKTERRRDRRLQTIVLGLSVLTSGALWVLVAQIDLISQWVTWLGAIVSTLATFLVLWNHTIGPAIRSGKLSSYFTSFGESLAHAREHPDNFTWHNFKHLESGYVDLGLPDPSKDQIRDAALTGMFED